MMRVALTQAVSAFDSGEIPIGAAIFNEQGELLSADHNRQIEQKNSCAHAELLTIQEAMRITKNRYLEGLTIAVTLEPCVMCAGAIAHSRPKKLIFGAWDLKAGAVGSVYDLLRGSRLPYPEIEVVAGVLEEESRELLQEFFNKKRDL